MKNVFFLLIIVTSLLMSNVIMAQKCGSSQNMQQMQTASWKEGVYLLRAQYKDELLTGKLVVKK